jgi:hypothetical protein
LLQWQGEPRPEKALCYEQKGFVQIDSSSLQTTLPQHHAVVPTQAALLRRRKPTRRTDRQRRHSSSAELGRHETGYQLRHSLRGNRFGYPAGPPSLRASQPHRVCTLTLSISRPCGALKNCPFTTATRTPVGLIIGNRVLCTDLHRSSLRCVRSTFKYS